MTNIFKIGQMAAMLACAAYMNVCLADFDTDGPSKPEDILTIRVESSNIQILKDVYERVLRNAGVTRTGNESDFALYKKLEAKYIGCNKCSKLDEFPGIGEITFIFPREHPNALSWVQNAAREQLKENGVFSHEVHKPGIEHGACPTPLSTNCRNLPACVSTNGCDNKINTDGCNVCQ